MTVVDEDAWERPPGTCYVTNFGTTSDKWTIAFLYVTSRDIVVIDGTGEHWLHSEKRISYDDRGYLDWRRNFFVRVVPSP